MNALSTQGLVVHTLHGQTMGTNWSVRFCASTDADLHAWHSRVQAVLDHIVAQMSTWEPDSDISRFNRAPAGQWQSMPAEFMRVLACSLAIARDSDGAFDPSVGSLVGAWGFGAHAREQSIPEASVQQAAQAGVGWQRLQVDVDASRVLQPGGLQLDFSAIAKGFGVDAVVEMLQARGVLSALVEVGGELRGFGRKPDGERWRVLMESAPDEEADANLPMRVIALDDHAVATSGDRWHAFEADGQRFSHTLDPRSGRPVQAASAAVTVVAPSAMEADGWATALTVLGVEAGLALAAERDLAVRYVVRRDDGLVEHCSPALGAWLS